MRSYIPSFDEFLIESSEINENKEDFVSATVAKDSGDLRKGQEVKVNALDYTKKGDRDKVGIIRPDGKKSEILKGSLSVRI
jgi:hypothetical protein